MCRPISSYELKLHTPNEVGAALVIDKNVSADRSATRDTVEPKKSMKANPNFFARMRRNRGGPKIGQKNCLLILVSRAIKPLGKIFRTPKTILIFFFFSEIQSVEAGFHVQPNFPTVILSLLTDL